jgi:hypothetical protein
LSNYWTNKWEKKDEIREGGWKVAWGRELTETDAIEGTVAAGISIYTGNAAALTAWIKNLVAESVNQMSSSIQNTFTEAAKEQAIALAKTTISNLLHGQTSGSQLLQFGNVQFKAGVGKYAGKNRQWIPNLSAEGGYWQTLSTTWAYQPYVALRFASAGTPPSAPGDPEYKTFIRDKWDAGLRITTFLYGGADFWAVVASKGTGWGEQSYNLSDTYPEDYLHDKFEAGYRVTELTCNFGKWAAVVSKETGYTAQKRILSATFPNDFVTEQWNQGYHLTHVTRGDNKWSVVMMKGTGYTKQSYQTSDAYPDTFIHDKFLEGFRLTSLTCEQGQWAAVMSKGTEFTSQFRQKSTEFPQAFIQEKWNAGDKILSLANGDGAWVAVMMGQTEWFGQSYKRHG